MQEVVYFVCHWAELIYFTQRNS